METKEYYQSLMAVIDYVAEGHKNLTAEKGQELSGRYWPRIYELFKAERIGTPFEGGSMYITRGQYLNPIYEDCIHAIKELDEQEADRELDRASKYAGIKYAKRAYWISIISIVVAAVALVDARTILVRGNIRCHGYVDVVLFPKPACGELLRGTGIYILVNRGIVMLHIVRRSLVHLFVVNVEIVTYIFVKPCLFQ